MRDFKHENSQEHAVELIEVARWEQYQLGDRMPFQAMWYTVPAGASCPRDQHPESELSLVISGWATVETGGTVTDLGPGSAFLLGGEEVHTVHNRGTEPLLVFSAYWMPTGGDNSGD